MVNRPATLAGEGLKAGVGIDGEGVPGQLQHGHIVDGVAEGGVDGAVGEALAQYDSLALVRRHAHEA